jgi:DNA-binding IclR family transcriptional regulator
VEDSAAPLGITELARRLNYSKSTTHGLVHALLREGALALGTDRHKLFLGPLIADLAFSSWNYLKIAELSQSIIDSIRDQVSETVFLGVKIRNRIIIMATSEAADALKLSAAPGAAIPLFAGAVGKVFLAWSDVNQVKQMIAAKGLPRYTPRSITDDNLYVTELERVRAQGYAVDDEEYLTGIRAVAVPLNNPKGPPMAVWVVGLTTAMDANKMQQVVDVTIGMAAKLSNLLHAHL